MRSSAVLLAFVSAATAFPGLSPRGLKRGPRYTPGTSAERRDAAPYSPSYPYAGALIDGLPGLGIGGNQVPAPGDSAHAFQHPPVGAFRGPCPGLNAAANHGFLSRDGVTTFDELVAAQQNMYNVGYDLAVVLATLGVVFDGDAITEKVSIGGDATSQTSFDGGLLGRELGFDSHDAFESDTSLTRNDFYLANGDNHSFNGTLFQRMINTAASTSSASNPLFNFAAMSKYRAQRYDESIAGNGQFYFGPRVLVLYGAASFLYELFPDSATGSVPSLAAISPFFGAVKASSGAGNATGGWDFVPERLPANWHNRKTPYTLADVLVQILSQYLAYPKIFGGNAGVGNFDPVDVPLSTLGGKATVADVACELYQAFLETYVPGTVSITESLLAFLTGKLNPIFATYGCPLINL